MQVQPIQSSTTELTPTTNTNFKQLKRIEVRGKNFKEYPEYATELLKTVKDAIKNDKEVAKFIDRFESSILLHSYTNPTSKITKTSVNIFYRNPNESLLKRFTNLFFGIPKDKRISISGFGHPFNGMKESVDYLTQGIKVGKFLNGQVRLVNEDFEKKLAKKEAKVFVRQQAEKVKSKRQLEVDKKNEELKNLRKDMTTKKEV